MIRLSLLQLRAQAITAAVAVTAFAVLLAVTGPHLASMYAASGLRGCRSTNCSQLASSFLQQVESTGPYATVSLLSIILIGLTPAVIGLFWGAPLIARELETGTFDLAWSQSVTRTRWLAVKLAVGGLAAMTITEALIHPYSTLFVVRPSMSVWVSGRFREPPAAGWLVSGSGGPAAPEVCSVVASADGWCQLVMAVSVFSFVKAASSSLPRPRVLDAASRAGEREAPATCSSR